MPPDDAPIPPAVEPATDQGWSIKLDNRVRALIACALVFQFIFTVIYSQVHGMPIDQNVFVVDVGLVTGAVGYYLGSSSGSTNKNPVTK